MLEPIISSRTSESELSFFFPLRPSKTQTRQPSELPGSVRRERKVLGPAKLDNIFVGLQWRI
ncbi:hypothetical protein K435DRAFT_782909 [Dendrothele bispora CBS 962.96]|uniref:Uncharacterized protein n=1 Tax=Dendrothele bispora (strain CBS 962.96) TaxID=1314807 RepID=A0A4S8KJX2_DENBC|nr:hypothetical protein K435DRAFT_787496 [Dendrothele bispora CBS 962.96]THU86350.1 hypothetical protein K435DRAFT_782909 [Dendrothele bispora CBS 962.96]